MRPGCRAGPVVFLVVLLAGSQAAGDAQQQPFEAEVAAVLARLRGLVGSQASRCPAVALAQQVPQLVPQARAGISSWLGSNRLLLGAVAGQQQVEQDTASALRSRFPTAEAAWATPVLVAIKTHHFFGAYGRNVPNCSFQGRPLQCEFVEMHNSNTYTADALWYHLPSICGTKVIKEAPHQLMVAMSMEAATYYSCLEDVQYMDQFDLEMTYRLCSHIPIPYTPTKEALHGSFFQPPLPWHKLQNAIAYINSNCGALNGRNDIVKQLMDLKKLEVHAWGGCLRNKVAPHQFEKMDVLRQYKFCIAMENSNSVDYVTEKIWHALQAGCVPIYLGAPNIDDFVPAPNSYISYRRYNSPEKLMDHLVTLTKDEQAWAAMHAWRTLPVAQLAPSFRKLVALVVPQPHSQCQLCQIVMQQRLQQRPLRGTHCMRNASWLQQRDSGSNISSWAPGSSSLLDLPLSFMRSDLGGAPGGRKLLW